MSIRGLACALALVGPPASYAWADGPGPDPAPFYDRGWRGPDDAAGGSPDPGRYPPRRVTGGPGYAGSDYGLGKPSYYGMGSRPDWGRGSAD